ncbi:hypothetical protein [Streptomyces sp. NPDC006012]|uniref:hypothetical protein n=1 Tax=Streptomyces sp. NPDC006012 TaxID=3364739 RepID=UPI00369A39F4
MPESGTTDVWNIDVERGTVDTSSPRESWDSRSFPESPDSRAERFTVGLRDQRQNLYAAVPNGEHSDGRPKWTVWMVEAGKWMQVKENQKTLTRVVKTAANAITIGSLGAELAGYAPAGSLAATAVKYAKGVSGAMNAGTQLADVYNYGRSAAQTFYRDPMAALPDTGKTSVQGAAMVAGGVNAFSSVLSSPPAAALVAASTATAALWATGDTAVEAAKKQAEQRAAFTHHRNDHIDVSESAGQEMQPWHGSQDQRGQSTTFEEVDYTSQRPPFQRRNAAEGSFEFGQGDVGYTTTHDSSASSASYSPVNTAQISRTAHYAAQGQNATYTSAMHSSEEEANQPVRRQTTWGAPVRRSSPGR